MAHDCLFCKIIAGEIPSTKVYSDEDFYAFRDINPVAPVHVLVVPRKHIPRITAADPSDTELLGKLLLTANKIAEQEGVTARGFRYVINCDEWGGQMVFHIHVHVIGGRKLSLSLG